MRSAIVFLPLLAPALGSVLERRACNGNNCNRAVTGTRNTHPDISSRRADCSSLMVTTVTGESTITTTTVTVIAVETESRSVTFVKKRNLPVTSCTKTKATSNIKPISTYSSSAYSNDPVSSSYPAYTSDAVTYSSDPVHSSDPEYTNDPTTYTSDPVYASSDPVYTSEPESTPSSSESPITTITLITLTLTSEPTSIDTSDPYSSDPVTYSSDPLTYTSEPEYTPSSSETPLITITPITLTTTSEPTSTAPPISTCPGIAGVPTYACACDDLAEYASACSCWGITSSTLTLPGPISTITETITISGSSTISTTSATSTPTAPTTACSNPGNCTGTGPPFETIECVFDGAPATCSCGLDTDGAAFCFASPLTGCSGVGCSANADCGTPGYRCLMGTCCDNLPNACVPEVAGVCPNAAHGLRRRAGGRGVGRRGLGGGFLVPF